MKARPAAAVALLVLTALSVGAYALELGAPVQPLVLGAFLLIAPGSALLLRSDGWQPLVLCVGVLAGSLAVDVLLATALFFLGWWSPGAVLACLAVLCYVSSALTLLERVVEVG